MNTRGVFLVLCFLLGSGQAYAVEVSGGLLGSYREGVWHHELNLNATQKWSVLKFDLGWTGEWSDFTINQKINWRGELGPLTAIKNQSHFTSRDVFRLIHKDNYSEETIALFFQSEGIEFGIFQKIPLKKFDLVDAWFCNSKLEVGSFTILGSQLKYSGSTESGKTESMQLEGSFGPWRVLAGHGWQEDSGGQESQARIGEIQKKGDFLDGAFTWQWVEPGFISPFAKTNKITPDRQGGKIELTAKFPKGKLIWNRRLHTNFAKDKNYNQLSWKIASQDQKFSVLWRLEPTTAFILTGENARVIGQFDALNGTLRLDWKGKQIFTGFRWDLERQIVRLELQSEFVLSWRAIGKYDFVQNRQHCYLSASWTTKSGELKAEFGSYDRGNILAGFNNTPSVGISWRWKF